MAEVEPLTFNISKLKFPVGSVIVDLTLVATMIWWGATVTEQLKYMNTRVEAIEHQTIQPEADKRIAVINTEMVSVNARLQSIESKLDKVLEKR